MTLDSRAPIPLNDLARQDSSEVESLTELVRGVIASGSYILGRNVAAFEKELAGFVGAPKALAVASGTDALVIAMRALGLGPGSVVATTANAGGYTTTAASLIGAIPLYVDCDENGQIDTFSLRSALISAARVDLVVITHLYGLLGPVEEVLEICAEFDVPLLEDCAQALGSKSGLSGGMAGSFGAVATFSFYPTKNLGALGDAGAISTASEELATKISSIRQYGWAEKYQVTTPLGTNSRMDEIQAAILRRRLLQLDELNRRRREIWIRYKVASEKNGKVRMLGRESDAFTAHLAVMDLGNIDLGTAREFFSKRGIQTGVHYPVLDRDQPGFPQPAAVTDLEFAEGLVSRIITLPLFPELRDDEVERVATAIFELEMEAR